MALFSVLFHDRAGGHFFCAVAVAALLFRLFLDVLVLALFFLTDTPKMFPELAVIATEPLYGARMKNP
jgi:hypothetical protein